MTIAFHEAQTRRVVLDLLRQKSDLKVFHSRLALTVFPMDKRCTLCAEDTRQFFFNQIGNIEKKLITIATSSKILSIPFFLK